MSSDQPQVSQDERRVLWQREKARREALWRLTEFRPGDPAAREILLVLDGVDGDDLSHPIGFARDLSLLGRLLALEPRDPGAIPILAELHDLQGLDDSQIPSLAVVREAIQQRLSDGHLTVWDAWLPLPWNLRLAHYLGTPITARQGWRIEDWEGL